MNPTTTQPSQKRRSRFRQEPQTSPRLVFQARDEQILSAVAKYRYMTTEGLLALFAPEGRGAKALRRRLTALFHHRLLARHYLYPLDQPVAVGSAQAIYVLDTEGAKRLWGSKWYLTKEGRPVARRKKVRYQHLRHSLGIAEVQLGLDLALAGHSGLAVHGFTADMEDTGLKVKVQVPRYRVSSRSIEVKGGTERLCLWPDASFWIYSREKRLFYFLEIDLADRKRERLFKRFLAYWQYVVREQKRLQKERTADSAFVVFVVPNERRRNTLIEVANQVPEIRRRRPYFWFVNQEDLSLQDPGRLIKKPLAQGLDGNPGFLTKP